MEKKFKKLACIVVTVMLVLSTMFIPVSAAEPSEREVKAALSKPEMPVISKLTNSYNAIVLKWNPVRDAKGYLVYRQTDSGSWKRVKTTSAVYYKDTAVKAGYQYTYIVKAYKTYKGKIIYSSYDKKGKSGKLTTAVSVSSPGAGTAALNWKKTAGASGYYIYRSSGKNGKYSKIKTISGGNTVSYENTGLQEGVYYYKVVPYGRINGKNVMSISSAAKGITVTGADIKLNKTELRLEEGKTYTLKVVGTSAKAVWKSGNDRTASVSSSGKVNGMKAGTAVITASVNGKSYKCTVVVEHIYSEATCTQPKRCQYCGKKEGAALGHDCISTVVEATKLTPGYTKHDCRRCGFSYTDSYVDYIPVPEQVFADMYSLRSAYPEGMSWTNNNFYAWNGGIYSGGYGCAGFAFRLSDEAFGYLPARMHENFEDIKVGDILRVNGDTHSVIVLEIRQNGVVIAEGNYNYSIHWGRVLSYDTIKRTGTYVMTRYPE